MNRRVYSAIFAALVCLAFGLLTGCSSSSSSSKTVVITASGGTPQTGVAVGANFAALSATVTTGGTPTSGASVTFTAPSTGASCTFSGGGATETDTTNSSGVATSSACTANSTAGAFTVTASTTGASSNASFSLTSVAAAAATMTASSGSGQSAAIGAAFTNPLVANVVDAFNNPVAGVSVTFTAPASGASGTFASNSTNTETDTTDASGNATSSVFTANSTVGGPYNVVASSTGLTSVNFAETNTAVVVTSANYVFYASGQELINGGPNYYAIAGALTIDSNGNVLNGEEDYNDAFGITSPGDANSPPTADTIAPGGTLVIDPTTGIGTLTITSSYTATGVSGVQTFAVQFVNPNHALITQFDGSATSSGSLDLQTATTITVPANFSFAMSGVDTIYASWDFGGVFSADASGNATGFVDLNDDGTVSLGNALAATSGTPDAFGRNVVTGIATPAVTLVSYPVGPEVMRLMDVDTTDAAVGSAYGQGSATFDDTSLTAGVFAEIGQWSTTYATVGEFATDSTTATFSSGLADDNEVDNAVQGLGNNITGSTYDLVSSGVNGYGSITLSGNGDVSFLGLYMVDPLLNINDPNNTTDVGGALIVDLDSGLPGGMGVITPQTDTTSTDFNGNYAAGFQNINQFNSACIDCELDMVGPFTMDSSTGLLSTATIGADDSDPFGTWTGTPTESTGDTFSSTPINPATGIFDMSQTNTPPNQLAATIATLGPGTFDADIFMASSTTLYWIEFDTNGVFLGSIEAQASVVKVRAAKRPGTKAKTAQKKAIVKGLGGHVK